MGVSNFRLVADRSHNPRGPDGQGWNRMAILPLTPSDRCMLRPRTRQAALDTARGMARFGSIVSYEDCCGHTCSQCKIANADREEWKPEWLLIEDDARGGVWLHADLEKDSFGHYYKSWEALTRAIHVPQLRRLIDPHWGAYFKEACHD
jgi:hypothetical protein